MVANGVGARNGILFKTAVSMEETGKTAIVALDKTGTITKGEPRVTDHRIKLTLHRLENVLNGDLDEIIDSLIAADQTAKLAKMEE